MAVKGNIQFIKFRKARRMDFGIIQKLAKCIIRPPKSQYKIADLVPPCFELKHRIYEHHQFQVLNNRGIKLQCSYLKDRYSPKPRDTIIFLHANGSCRLAMKNYLDPFLQEYDLVSFDFAGCGLSEGEYISLGYNEREDVYAVVNHIRREYGVTNLILWGRSMGAATAILYTAKYGGVQCIISDNSYADLEVLINELSDDYLPFLPNFLVDGIITSIQEYIEEMMWKKESTDFNVRKLKPIKMVEKITCPIIFIGSTQDTFVNVKHTKELYSRTKTVRWLELVKGNHNDPRTSDLKDKILNHLLEIKQNKITSATNPVRKEKHKLFQQLSPQVSKNHSNSRELKETPESSKQMNSPFEVQLVNCAQLEYQKKSLLSSKIEEKISKDLSSMDSSSSDKKSRESYMQRKMKQLQQNKRNRSRSGIKRKKIFEGIDFINQHLNGQQN